MGTVLSALRSVTKGATAVVKLLADLNRQYQALLTRVNAPPGLPYEKPSAPYWLDDPPFPELVRARSEEMPGEADVVVIGSGITAAAVVWGLLFGSSKEEEEEEGKKVPRVVVLEARELCAGATGRNGGHVKASPHALFPRLAGVFGKERARELVRFTLRTAGLVGEVGGGREVAAYRAVETVDFFLDEASFEGAKKEVAELKLWIPEFEIRVMEREAAREEFGVQEQHVFGALVYEAGALWPYRMVASCWREMLDKAAGRLSIETETAVEGIEVGDGGGTERRPYVVRTGRGDVRARHVVHATNAHAAQSLPGLRGKMAGVKAHMSAQKSGGRFAWRDGRRSWSVLYGGGMFDYVTQRPNGDVMLGGGFARSLGQGVDMVGVYEDGSTEGLTVAHVGGVMGAVFGDGWDGRVERVWSGIIGVTGDMAPFVGRVPEGISGRKKGGKGKGVTLKKQVKKVEEEEDGGGWIGAEAGEWVSAGYSGDGMVWAWGCGAALGVMISGREGEVLEKGPGFPGGRLEEWFPRDLVITEARVRKADLSNLLDELM
ncbi:inositol hexaphosphate kinase kcs1 [Colletotrichum kahawae]|uniref:Inositol hexaphosphate kinase kcs1 n=1 Tax=Colletotrichum kahawae TaxID=34407 RepID=A0AAE0CY79_COLKA|nr:inositol hexaphosphate kinase kcs1 [Colletotrichum kahawae]